jgi:L-aminopeptidase/D-esterase-like protein
MESPMKTPGSSRLWICGALVCVSITSAPEAQMQSRFDQRGLTAVAGISVGHHTLAERPTGCTVVLTGAGAVAGVDVRGAAPGTRETDLLDPLNLVERVHAIVLAGGSAFGLDAASGVMRYLDERKVGFPTPYGVVPIVPAAILFDLAVGDARVRPTADCGYAAARAATDGPVTQGNVGAGAGATVGKLLGMARAMKGGTGSASITLPGGLTVAALVAVNAFGDIIDPATGRVIAGVRTIDGRGLADARVLIRTGASQQNPIGENSTIGVVATNARLTKAQATKVAQMAHDGLARAISPVHSMNDGDTLFALATGRFDQAADVSIIGALAADVVAEAVLNAVRQATGLPGLPAVRDLAAAAGR